MQVHVFDEAARGPAELLQLNGVCVREREQEGGGERKRRGWRECRKESELSRGVDREKKRVSFVILR